MYCPLGFIDSEDGVGNTIDGGWRGDGDVNTGMQPVSHMGSNSFVKIDRVQISLYII